MKHTIVDRDQATLRALHGGTVYYIDFESCSVLNINDLCVSELSDDVDVIYIVREKD